MITIPSLRQTTKKEKEDGPVSINSLPPELKAEICKNVLNDTLENRFSHESPTSRMRHPAQFRILSRIPGFVHVNNWVTSRSSILFITTTGRPSSEQPNSGNLFQFHYKEQTGYVEEGKLDFFTMPAQPIFQYPSGKKLTIVIELDEPTQIYRVLYQLCVCHVFNLRTVMKMRVIILYRRTDMLPSVRELKEELFNTLAFLQRVYSKRGLDDWILDFDLRSRRSRVKLELYVGVERDNARVKFGGHAVFDGKCSSVKEETSKCVKEVSWSRPWGYPRLSSFLFFGLVLCGAGGWILWRS